MYHGHYNVTVTAPKPKSISLPSSWNVKIGEETTLTPTITPSGAETTLSWPSDNTYIATVSSNGTVTGKNVGTTKIWVKTDNGLSASCAFTVKPINVTNISLNNSRISLFPDDFIQLSATVSPSNATDKSVTWKSNNDNVATVSSTGLVTAKAVGNATITCTANDGSGKYATCSVTVSPPIKVSSITLNEEKISLFIGDSIQLSATVLPSNATNKEVTWKTVDENGLITVSNKGVVTAIKEGSSSVKCMANDGSGVTATCTVTVAKPNVIADITSANFPDEYFRNWMLIQDYGKDGKLTENEIKKVTSISVSGILPIGNLEGIEYFTNLETLNCSGCNLYFLDVSKNTALTTLMCYNCNLYSLDVSKNTALKYLCCDFNQLTSLDVSKNTALTDLSCYYNQLTSLDVSKNTTLEWLKCFSNQLTSLDVSKNTALTNLWCYHNMISDTNMDNLINSLRQNNSSYTYSFRIIDNRDGNEGNVCTKRQVAAVKAKRWKPEYYDGSDWKEYEGSYDNIPIENDGTLLKPFTPSEAKEFVTRMDADVKSEQEYYIKGKIIEITDKNQFGTQYGNCTYYISDDGTDKYDKFYIYRTLYIGNVTYSDDSWLKPKAGDEVIICGKVVNYRGNTPETFQNQSYIYSLNGRTQIHDYYYYVGNQNGWECVPTEEVLWKGSYNVDWGTPYEGLKTELINHVKSGSILRAYVSQTADDYCVGGASTGGWANILTGKIDPDREDFLISGDMVLEYPLNDLSIQLLQEQDGFLMVGHGYTLTKITVVNPIPFKKLSDGITWELSIPCEIADEFKIGTFASLVDGWSADVFGSSEDNPSTLNGIMSKINGPTFQVPFVEGMYSYTVKIVPSTMNYEIIINTKATYPQGDVNMDNAVNGTDLVALSNIVLGRKEKTETADVNGDGSVNGTDIVALSNIILGRNNKAPRRTSASGASLSIEDFDIKAGETKEMLIDLSNPNDEVTLVQFDLYLPAGLSIKKSGSDLDFDMAGRTSWRKHTLDANEVDGAYRFLLYSSGNTLIEGTSGAIIKVNIVADESFNGGKIVLDNILLVDPNEKETKPEAYEYVIPTPDDGSAKLSIEPFDIAVGETKEMLIDLSNPNDEVTLVQFDLHLPAGLSIKKSGSDLDFDMAGRTSWRKHTLDANEVDGAYRFLLYSSGNTLIEGASGAIIKVNIVADESFNGGNIVLDNILLVDPNEKETKPASYEYEIGSGSGISTVMMDASGKKDRIYNLSGQKLTAPQKGINIIGGKKVVVK